ncbi:2169_t:CDS:2 [Entrophospora sp. SA101]|nr:2169_t:CDS:2 [Entrophospora sp. SA101]
MQEEKYNLSTESSPSQLRVYASELGAMLPDWKARKSVKEALRRRLFKEYQIKALVPDKRNEKLTIKERAQYCAKTEDPYDIWLHALDLIKTKNNSDEEIVASNSRLTLFPQHLSLLCRIAMRHKIDRFDSGTYYAEGDTSSDSDTNPDTNTEPEPKSQPKNNDLSKEVHREHYNPFDTQLAEIDSMLAEM